MTHPLAFPGNRSGARTMRAGDRVIYTIDGRRGVADEFLSDGDTFVSFDDGEFGNVKWNHLEPESPPLYQVWFVPSDEGKRFGSSLKAIGQPQDQEAACLAAYELENDARVPDQHEYFRYRVLPVLDA